jgi:dienelactone hydrolase
MLVSFFVLMLGVASAGAKTVHIPLPDGTMLAAELFLPAAPSRGPAIVALHGCGGPFPARDRQWREKLTGEGHIMLFPNSFSSRGLGPQCRVKMSARTVTSFSVRRSDAIEAARWLSVQPGVPEGGVVLLGWSDGGSTVMAAASAAPNQAPEPVPGLIRGLIAFYPGCLVARNPGWKPVAPLLVLMGEADDWTPAKPCQAVAARFEKPAMEMVTFPGAYHDFDAPGAVRVMQNVPSSQNADKSVHAGNDPAAQAAVLRMVPAFLAALPPAPHP